jgi:hypothetical protein
LAVVAIAGCSDGSLPNISGELVEVVDDIDSGMSGEEDLGTEEDTAGIEEGSGKGGGNGPIFDPPTIPPVINVRPKPDLTGIDRIVGGVKPIMPQKPVRVNPDILIAGGIHTAPISKPKLKVEMITPYVQHAETDLDITLYLCPKKEYLPGNKFAGSDEEIWPSYCSKHELGEDLVDDERDDLFERGSHDEFILEDCKVTKQFYKDGEYVDEVESCNFEDMKYFQVKIRPRKGKDRLLWMLQGIKLAVQWHDAAGELVDEKVIYWNPCLNAELSNYFYYINMSRDDSQFCVVTRTGDDEDAGTDKKVYFSYTLPSKYGDKETAEENITDVKLGLGRDPGEGRRYDFDDMEEGMEATYGIRFYDEMAFGLARPPKIVVWKDSKNDDWVLDSLEVYAFHPGKSFAQDPDKPVWFSSLIKSWGGGKKYDGDYNGQWMRLEDGVEELPDAFYDMPINWDGIH